MKTLLFTAFAFIFFANPSSALPIHGRASLEQIHDLLLNNQAYNFEGIVKLNNCSGALVRFENSKDSDKAMVLSNGHCVPTSTGMMKPNAFLYRVPVKRGFRLLKADGSLSNNTVNSTQILYATMTGTDVSLYELDMSYEEIKSNYKTSAIVIESNHPTAKDGIDILSGYWQRGYSCSIDAFIFKLLEDAYTSFDSIRYTQDGCHTIHGTSGSPILSAKTHKVVGVNNTGNDNGERCTMDNPCEVSATGEVYYKKGLSYGQQTYLFYSCLNAKGELDLKMQGCKLYH